MIDLREQEQKDGWRWLIGGGVFALCVCAFIFLADQALTNSDREQRLGRTLKELRTAQFEVGVTPSDERLTVSPAGQ